jgi:hypothetical protein
MSSKKLNTLISKYRAIEKIGTDIEVPYEVMRVIGARRLSIMGDLVSIGTDDSDYCSIDEARIALGWYVTQLDGVTQWREF